MISRRTLIRLALSLAVLAAVPNLQGQSVARPGLAYLAVDLRSGRVIASERPERLDVPVSGQETGYGLGWDLETVTLAGEQTRSIGHDGDVLGGTVASFMSFPERGLAVSVTSNIAYADTPAVALKIARAFAQQSAVERVPAVR